MVDRKVENKKKIFFFNGALGSGKTTLINQLISSNVLGKFFIIENEISSLGVDNQCLHLDPKQIKTFAGECICCSDPEELKKVLKKIAEENYENVVIESSGVTSMNQLLSKILIDQELSEIYTIGAAVFLVDALGLDRTDTFDLEVSDFVVVTKLDAIKSIEQREKVEKYINEKSKSNATGTEINFNLKNTEADKTWIDKLLANEPKTFREWSQRVGDGKYHGTNFVSIVQTINLEKYNLENIYMQMRKYSIVRIKGYLNIGGTIKHIEMTPEQMKVEEESKKIENLGLVVIGRNKFLLDEFVDLVK